MENASHKGQSFQTNQSQPRHQKLSSASSGPVYQEHTSLPVRGLNNRWTKPAPGRFDASMSAGHAPRNEADIKSFSLARPLSIPDLYRSSNTSIYGFDTLNSAAANTSVLDLVEEQRVAFPKHRIWSLKSSSGGSSRTSSGGVECEGGYASSIQPFRPIKVPDRLLKSTSTEVAELDKNLPFPAKLHYIISNPKYQKFITWCSHGRAWRVLRPRGFEKHVIPIFCRSDRFASFMRQVRAT
jgi:hypothetical protein